jgi:hypothetical protein
MVAPQVLQILLVLSTPLPFSGQLLFASLPGAL